MLSKLKKAVLGWGQSSTDAVYSLVSNIGFQSADVILLRFLLSSG